MFRLAWRNLTQEPARLLISVGGVALALLLILLMAGIFAGAEEHAVSYINQQPAPLWLMQAGVENMHMASSLLTAETVTRVREVPGVAQAVGGLYATAGVDLGGNVIYSYVFGFDASQPFGGPWKLVQGRGGAAPNEIILDQALAARYGLGVGNTVGVLGNELTIVGLSKGTFGLATNMTFVNKAALASLMGVSPEAASYVLIQPEPGTDLATLQAAIRATVPEANLLTQQAFAASDQEMIRQMGVDVIRAMNLVAYAVGLLVIGLTIYTATLERAREYGVLKALGANNRQLLQVVFGQAFVSAGLGTVAGIGLAYGVGALITRALPEMSIVIRPGYLVGELPTLVLITAVATLLPTGRILRLDPMVVFRA
jgi:putative ABC transport system permease protein